MEKREFYYTWIKKAMSGNIFKSQRASGLVSIILSIGGWFWDPPIDIWKFVLQVPLGMFVIVLIYKIIVGFLSAAYSLYNEENQRKKDLENEIKEIQITEEKMQHIADLRGEGIDLWNTGMNLNNEKLEIWSQDIDKWNKKTVEVIARILPSLSKMYAYLGVLPHEVYPSALNDNHAHKLRIQKKRFENLENIYYQLLDTSKKYFIL